MEDLQYILGIGFSGSDLPRAIIIAFILAMFARRNANVWIYGFIALFIDRMVWPIAAMASAGAEPAVVLSSFGALFQTLRDDLGIYFVRYIGLVVMMLSFRWLRTSIQRITPGSDPAPA